MASPVIMPRQGQSVESCIITEWFKKKGEKVSVGDVLFSYETDKASFEEEAKDEGILLDVFYEEGDEVPVLTNVAVIGKEGEDTSEFSGGAPSSEAPKEAEKEVKEEKPAEVKAEQAKPAVQAVAVQSGDMQKVSPRARMTADKKGVSIQGLAGSGPEGRIIERDVLAAAESGAKITPVARERMEAEKLAAPGAGSGLGGTVRSMDLFAGQGFSGGNVETKKVSNIRKIISKKMHESLQGTAQLTLHSSADARKLMQLRKEIKKQMAGGANLPNITINDLVCFAVIKVLQKHQAVNSHFLGDEVKFFKNVNLGLAVDTERGLMVPTVMRAEMLNIKGLSEQIKALAESCRTGSIDPELLSGASFTLTNLGSFGIEMFTPVLNPPQVGILGVNTITSRPVDLGNGTFGFVPYIGLSLTFDHRALDGAPAAAFLKDVCDTIKDLEIDL